MMIQSSLFDRRRRFRRLIVLSASCVISVTAVVSLSDLVSGTFVVSVTAEVSVTYFEGVNDVVCVFKAVYVTTKISVLGFVSNEVCVPTVVADTVVSLPVDCVTDVVAVTGVAFGSGDVITDSVAFVLASCMFP